MDSCGNSTSAVQIITIADTTPPLLVIPANVSIDCATSPNPTNTGTATATDDCGTVSVSYTDTPASSCGPSAGIFARSWSAVDACGNSTNAVQIITITDTTAPSFLAPPDLALDCAASTNVSATGIATGLADDCSGATLQYQDVLTPGTGANLTIRRVWSATDECGNTSVHTQVLTVTDTTPPTFTVPPSVTIVSGAPNGPAATGIPTNLTDDCSPVSQGFTDMFTATGPNGAGTILRTWNVWDPNGNTNTIVQSITVLPLLPDLQLSSTVNGPSSNLVTLLIDVVNVGAGDAFNVVFTNPIPAGVLSASTPTPGCTISGGLLTCNLGTLAAGSSPATVELQFSTDPASSAPITNISIGASDTRPDPTPADNIHQRVIMQDDKDGDNMPDWSDPDDDNDLIPDFWEIFYGLDPCDAADAALDPDGDGFSNLEEYIADTHPGDGTIFLRLVDDADVANGHEVFWPSQQGRLYTIETTTDLTPGVWVDLPGFIDIVGTGGVQSIVDPNPSVVLRHYRVKVRLP